MTLPNDWPRKSLGALLDEVRGEARLQGAPDDVVAQRERVVKLLYKYINAECDIEHLAWEVDPYDDPEHLSEAAFLEVQRMLAVVTFFIDLAVITEHMGVPAGKINAIATFIAKPSTAKYYMEEDEDDEGKGDNEIPF